MRNLPPFFQNLILIIVSILTTLLFIEGGMRLTGLALSTIQASHDKISFADNEIRILCIGESTTFMGKQWSYPSQLESILNNNSQDKVYTVINKGLISTTSNTLLAKLDHQLKKYRPHIVITMIGVNDYLIETNKFAFIGTNFLSRLKVWQLIRLIQLKIASKISSAQDPALSPELSKKELVPTENMQLEATLARYSTIEQELNRLKTSLTKAKDTDLQKVISANIVKYHHKGAWTLVRAGQQARYLENYDLSLKLLAQAVKLKPRLPAPYIEMGRTSKTLENYPRAIFYFNKAVKAGADSPLVYLELGSTYSILKQFDKAYEIAQILLTRYRHEFEIHSKIAAWLEGSKYESFVEEQLILAAEHAPSRSSLYENLAEFYERKGLLEKAETYKKEALILEAATNGYTPITVQNYNLIANLINDSGAQMIAMQYPRRNISILKDIFWDSSPIIFVENKKNFAEALKYGPYSEYFSDTFAIDFGHCTIKGNRLIANNLADVILKLHSGN